MSKSLSLDRRLELLTFCIGEQPSPAAVRATSTVRGDDESDDEAACLWKSFKVEGLLGLKCVMALVSKALQLRCP